MKTAAGKCNADSVMIGEVHFVRLGNPQVPLTAKYALVASKDGTTYGSGTTSGWSQETMDKWAELQASMEADLVGIMFEGAVEEKKEPAPVYQEDQVPEL